MNVQSVDRCSFGAKNTYLNLAEKSVTKDDKLKYLSYHNEAKARYHYLRLQKETDKRIWLPLIEGVKAKDIRNIAKALPKAVYHKISSWYYIVEAYKLYPKRFK